MTDTLEAVGQEEEEETRVSSVSRIVDKAGSSESCLVTIYGPDLGKQYKLEEGQTSIGRGGENHIVVDMNNVSRRHALVNMRNEGFFVEDLKSTNGTFVNDSEVEIERPLRNGDLIKIGSVIFKFLQGGDIEAQFHEVIYQMTIVDGLTQIHNKRYFEDFLEREMARCARYERPLSLALFDIDHFKRINDDNGHLAGDFVLKRLAEVVRSHIRREEAFARYGGEEFAVIMPETTADRARTFADKIRHLVEQTSFEYEGQHIKVTISIGLSEMGPYRTLKDFIAASDAALFEAKNAGRNTVICRKAV